MNNRPDTVQVPIVAIIDDDHPHRMRVDIGKSEPIWIPRSVIIGEGADCLHIASRWAEAEGLA